MAMPEQETQGTDPAGEAEGTTASPGWPGGMPYTVLFPDGSGYLDADLEHPAPLPRIGDTVEYVDEVGTTHRYRVLDVIHTLQAADPRRTTAQEIPEAERPGATGQLRAGLPKVLLEPIS